MTELQIKCPECGTEIEIAEQLAAPLVEAERVRIADQAIARAQKTFQNELNQTRQELAEKDAKLEAAEKSELEARKAKATAEEARRNIELEVERKVEAGKALVAEQATEKARRDYAAKLEAAEQRAAEQAKKLEQAESAELAAIKAKAEAEEAKRTAELAVERRMAEEREKLRQATRAEADEEHRLKLAENEEQMKSMRKQVDELKRRSEVGSQQRQGDVLELDLTSILQNQFPNDRFERVAKGARGGDVVQTVINEAGQDCGRILWESKRTKAWSESWLAKLRTDQRECRADIAALVSQTLPDGTTLFEQRDNVWVTSLSCTLPMAAALRRGLTETARARQALAGAESKKAVVYDYLTGNEFRQRIGGLVEVYLQLRADLDKEKRSYTRLWNSREKQLDRMMHSMCGLYGDLHGMTDGNLPIVAGLDFDDGPRPLLVTESSAEQGVIEALETEEDHA